jgi:hypothetical protein
MAFGFKYSSKVQCQHEDLMKKCIYMFFLHLFFMLVVFHNVPRGTADMESFNRSLSCLCGNYLFHACAAIFSFMPVRQNICYACAAVFSSMPVRQTALIP